MPAIPLKRIITFSSEASLPPPPLSLCLPSLCVSLSPLQDVIHKASNLLSPSAGLHWASSPDYRSKCLTVELEMAKQSKIVQIEVGKSGNTYHIVS